ncbi:hypothetical protein CFIMG_003214RA [Ceratocystis fimbriata CBS 114723]|uniref:Nucleic acid-binding, OB-fold protein n=1 Tax=Ceratocystis fimbriata CBS 114723 TaxID=1035309 RepID=A0A2C5WVI8_9PEZI|nr:hypothetical protein CFIMG_003214RA [Ceratocystis fimbriata CBS 114723]
MTRIILLTGAPLPAALLEAETTPGTSSETSTETHNEARTGAHAVKIATSPFSSLLPCFEPCYARIDKSLPIRPEVSSTHTHTDHRSKEPAPWRVLSHPHSYLSTSFSQASRATDFLNLDLLQASSADSPQGSTRISPSPTRSAPKGGDGLTTLLNQSWSCILDESNSAIPDLTEDIPGNTNKPPSLNPLLQFYEESILLYSVLDDDADVTSTSVAEPPLQNHVTCHPPATPANISTYFSLEADSDIDTTISMSTILPSHSPTPSLQTFLPGASRPLSNLKDLPSSAQLAKIQQQESRSPFPLRQNPVLVNLIVGIISISAPRTITTRWGSRLQLVELLVGDNTRAGFSVSFWLPLATQSGVSRPVQSSNLATLLALQRQDIILLQNVLLASFANKVFGQNVKGGDTSVNLLYRHSNASLPTHQPAQISGHYSAADLQARTTTHPQLEKTRCVRQWVINFVGSGPIAPKRPDDGHNKPSRETKRQIRTWDQPPPDSQ